MIEKLKYEPAERRPIASRRLKWIQIAASWLANHNTSPNAISATSTVFAVCGAGAIVATEHATNGTARFLWLVAAVLVQMRLLANLFDGMVALESGKASAVGELFNEVPDRISDAALFIALGFVSGSSPHLGYAAAILAVFVAYIRAMGAVAGAGQLFGGLMAKPQRMFLVTVLCLFQMAAPASWQGPWLPRGVGFVGCVLLLIAVGCVVTSWTRLTSIAKKLRARA